MIALTASVLLAIYLIVPELLFRLVSGRFVPLRTNVRTRSEELTRAFVTIAIPLVITFTLISIFPFCDSHPFSTPRSELRVRDYELVFSGLYSEAEFRTLGPAFWDSTSRVSRHQANILFWYYVLMVCEGMLLGVLASKYGRLKHIQVYSWVADKFIFPKISEWHVLLTPFAFANKSTTVWADVLTTSDNLYKGRVKEHFVATDSKLSGLILTDARRFDRHGYLLDKDEGRGPKADAYWKDIPGAKLYIAADKIVDLNLNYESPETIPRVVERFVAKQFEEPLTEFKVTVKRAPRGSVWKWLISRFRPDK